MLEEWGVQADAKRRALRKLERAGLIKVERRGKRSPHVTLLVKDFDGRATGRAGRQTRSSPSRPGQPLTRSAIGHAGRQSGPGQPHNLTATKDSLA
jgi:hypothetical protein